MNIVDLMDKYDIGYCSVNHNRNRCMDCGFENANKVWALSLLTMKLISHSLTPVHHLCGILSLIGFGNFISP